MSLFRTCLIVAVAVPLFGAESPEAVRKEITALYARALEATRNATSIEDLDEIDRTFNTRDWQSIAPGQPVRTWPDIRKYGFEGQNAPFKSAEILIDTFQLSGDTVVFTGRLR